MSVVISILTAFGAVVPAAVAIIAPVGLTLARRHGINPVLMSLLIINGASAGGFCPLSVFGLITNGVSHLVGLRFEDVLVVGVLSAAVQQLLAAEQGSRGRPTATAVGRGIGTGQPGRISTGQGAAGRRLAATSTT